MSARESFFDFSDQRIEEFLGVDHAEVALVEIYSELSNNLEDRIATAAGIAGLAEYALFPLLKTERRSKKKATLFCIETLNIKGMPGESRFEIYNIIKRKAKNNLASLFMH